MVPAASSPRVLLCAHLLLLLLWPGAHASQREEEEGEWCWIWPPGEPSPVGAFLCPQPHDGADAKFCCGSCLLPYCCTSAAPRRLRDQGERCARLRPRNARLTTTSSPPRSLPPETSDPATAWTTLGLVVMVTSGCALLFILFCWCTGRSGFWPHHQPLPPDAFNDQNLAWMQWASRHPDPTTDATGPPPSYDEDPPPYSAEGCPPHWDSPPPSPGEEAMMLGPLVHRNVPGHALEAATEAETSVDL